MHIDPDVPDMQEMTMDQTMEINGIRVDAHFNDEDVNGIFLPLLELLTQKQKKKGARLIVMIAAPPGAGKSTLVSFLEDLARKALPDVKLQAVGMDGFHRRQAYLMTHTLDVDGRQVPMVDVKGAPETFDLERLREHIGNAVRCRTCGWPAYDRHLHDPEDDAITVDCDILLIEGNYLLLEEPGWSGLSGLADHTVFIEADEELLRSRLIDRKEASGNTREHAERFVEFSDLRNARRCLAKSKKADLRLRVSEDGRFAVIE